VGGGRASGRTLGRQRARVDPRWGLGLPGVLVLSWALILSSATGQERLADRAPTPFTEQGKPVSLEVVVVKPVGPGPFPTVMFNHGSTGRGDNPSIFGRTWTSDAVGRFFNERGWLVAFPQRRGRGGSDGLYDEGFERDRSRYSCVPALSLAGLERALDDLDAAVAYLKSRPDVDARRMVIGGQSRGGILAIAYAGTRPQHFAGAINFVGGWMSDRCPDPEAINTVTFRRGAAFPGPTLWLYGDNDSFYRIEHSRKNFDAFVAAGGKGAFFTYALGPGANGHTLIARPDQWQDAAAAFIGSIK
jgi:dienelactone hydrolase